MPRALGARACWFCPDDRPQKRQGRRQSSQMMTTPTNDTRTGPAVEALPSETMPQWLWDPAAARIVWANEAALAYGGARALDDLRRLHFRTADAFVRQLAQLAATDLGESGRSETIRFGGQRAYRFLCRNMPTDGEAKGLLLGLIGPAGDDPAPPAAKRNGRADAPIAAAANPPAQAMRKFSRGGKNARTTRTGEARTADAAMTMNAAPLGSPPPSPAAPDQPAVRPAAVDDPTEPLNGHCAAPVDAEDLITLREIARLINGAASVAPGAVAAADVGGAAALARPGNKARDNGGEPLAACPGAAGDTNTADAARLIAETMQPRAAASLPERNPFLEALPAAVAIAMGGRLMRANESFLYAFGFGSESELHRAGGLASLFPDSRNGVLVVPDSDSPQPPRAARVELLAVSRSGRRRRVPLTFRSVSTGREPVQVIILAEEAPPGAAPDNVPRGDSGAAAGDDSIGLLARVSHEIRTPLNSIIGFSELAKDESLGQNDIKVLRGYAGDIHSSAMHALSLVNDLLDTTKIMAGAAELDLAPVAVNDIVAEALQLMRPQIGQKRLDLAPRLTPGLPPLLADRRRLKQILLNLVANAVKFTPQGGSITVITRFERGGITLLVEDTGIGMDAAGIALALQPYRQLARSIDTASEQRGAGECGTGLGLPLTKALAEAHGARFRIDSTPGGGTSVELHFPPDRLVR